MFQCQYVDFDLQLQDLALFSCKSSQQPGCSAALVTLLHIVSTVHDRRASRAWPKLSVIVSTELTMADCQDMTELKHGLDHTICVWQCVVCSNFKSSRAWRNLMG